MNNTTAVEKAMKKPATVKEWLSDDSFKQQVALALPKHLTPERFIRIAITAVNKTPKLAECTPSSVLNCLLTLSSLGLELDGRRAHLIPYGKEATLIVDYKGIVDLVRRSGEVAYIHADVVGEKDTFEYNFGTGARMIHKPNFADRGKIICAYSFIKLKDGSEDFDVMSVDEIEKIRSRSRSGTSGPWKTDWNEMAKKTVFRRHSKWLPFSPELRDAIERDDEPMTEQERFAASKPALVSEPNFLLPQGEPETVNLANETQPEAVEVKP